MDEEEKRELEEAVIQVLRNGDLENITESKVRSLVAGATGIDLSSRASKKFVKEVIDEFLAKEKAEECGEEEKGNAIEGEENGKGRDEVGKKVVGAKRTVTGKGKEEIEDEESSDLDGEQEENEENDDSEEDEKVKPKKRSKLSLSKNENGDIIVCQLSATRSVTIQDWRGKQLVSIRQYYEKDGKLLPTSKGISLTVEQWEAFKKGVPAIEKAVKSLT